MTFLRQDLRSVWKHSPAASPVADVGDVEEQRMRTQSTADATEQHNTSHNVLFDFPNELVLSVASFLDKASQLLLSLSCRRFRILLNSRLDLTLHDRVTKVQFLKVLELDYPEYLTCRYCAVLYPWRGGEPAWCLCFGNYSCEDTIASVSRYMLAGPKNCRSITREVVDLILRAHDFGPSYGLPLSFLNRSDVDRYGISRTREARIVNGQLIHSSRAEVEAESNQEIASMARHLDRMDPCLHLWWNVGNERQSEAVQSSATSMRTSEEVKRIKCSYCETDHEICVTNLAKNRTRIVLNIWRNYGRRNGNMQSNEQLFRRHSVSQLHTDTVLQRDVRAIFESGTVPDQSIASFTELRST